MGCNGADHAGPRNAHRATPGAEVGRRTWTTARETLVSAPDALVKKPLKKLLKLEAGKRKGGDHDSDLEDAGGSSTALLQYGGSSKGSGGGGSSSRGDGGGGRHSGLQDSP
jgi:hypothetical protein